MQSLPSWEAPHSQRLLRPPASENTDTGTVGTLEEITVTAQRRSESMQNVPISMQAFTSETLKQLNVSTLDDYIKFLPNVTTANNGPARTRYSCAAQRRLATQPGQRFDGLVAERRNLPGQPIGQLPNRNLDVYAADLNRIEVLEGPQGTLFGAGAEQASSAT